MLTYSDGRSFSQGACHCLISPLDNSCLNRIILQVNIEGIEDKAVIDTGGAYLICSREISDYLRPSLMPEDISQEIQVRGLNIKGTLHRFTLRLLADEGNGVDIDIDATALVPESNSSHNLPTILGLMGCLERLKFAVDPSDDTFYFGDI